MNQTFVEHPLKAKSRGLNGLDLKLLDYLERRDGFFIEAGGNDGVNQSNSFILENEFGWKGMLIEPVPSLAEKCRQNRPRCIVESSALVASDYSGKSVEMRYCNLMSLVKGAMGSETADDEHIRKGCECEKIESFTQIVPAATLSSFIDKNRINHIDLLSLDVEGYEAQALQGLDFDRHAPDFILVEARFLKDVDRVLLPHYVKVATLSYHDVLYRRMTVPPVKIERSLGHRPLEAKIDAKSFFASSVPNMQVSKAVSEQVRTETSREIHQHELLPATEKSFSRPRNIVISGTNFWNPGDDFVRDGIIRVLREVFASETLNFLFYNFNADFFPQEKFAGIGNYIAKGDLEKYRDFVDAVVIAGLSAGDEIKDLYCWIAANGLAEKVYLIGAGYENGYVEKHISQEPEATIFRKARVILGRTEKTPEFVKAAGIPYVHINCPAILSVPEVKKIAPGHKLKRIGFSIQLPSGEGLANQSCAREQYELALAVLHDLARSYEVEVVAHHKTEYFHFLNLLRGRNIPVIFSSFYQDLNQIYPRYDLVITTRLHASLFANGHGIPGIIINDTDRHTHALEGFLHSIWADNRAKFEKAFAHWSQSDLAAIAHELQNFKSHLLARYVQTLRPVMNGEEKTKAEISAAPNPLSIHFFTIVLNGQPFIRHHIEAFKHLPFVWHWHIVEGVAELNHDTAWPKAAGGKIPGELHRGGMSVDGTTEYLDVLQKEFPENITVYRPPAGKFWDGKREMVNAPLAGIREACLLWQVDADELWTFSQIIRARAMFLAHREKTAAMFFCHYFVGPELVVTSRDTYGNNSSYEWLRVWRYQPGDRWVAHEPPRLCRGETDVASLNPFRHAETEAMGLVFQHFAYALEEQLRFKESYYGYAGAVEQWRKLQQCEKFPQPLSAHFAWVKDAAIVNTAAATGVKRLAPDEWFGIAAVKTPNPLDGVQRILFVRTDSIGDAVLASAMLEPLRRKHPQAKLAVLCQQHVAELFTACPFVDAIICYDHKKMDAAAERAQILAEIAEFQPDLILNSVRSRDHFSNALAQLFRPARHLAIEGDLNNISLADHMNSLGGYESLVPTPGEHKTELARHADFLAGLGIPSQNLQPVVWTSSADEALADAFFQEQQLDPLQTIAVFPGAQHEMRVYHGYAAALAGLKDFKFLVFGDASQTALAEALEFQLPGRTVNLCGRSTLRETVALLRRCRLYVGAESAGAHLACAVGVPNVVLLGGGHFGRFMPYSPLTSAVAQPLDCFGCNWRCPHQRAHCIKDVAPEMLASAIRRTLEVKAPRARIFLQSAASWQGGISLPAWQQPDSWLAGMDVEIVGLDLEPPAKIISAAAGNIEVVGEGIPNPLVSVVVSTFKSEKLIRACLENLSRQTIFDRCEILVVDSGSPENERAIVLELQEKFSNLRYVRTRRETLYGAWNQGLTLARGRYWANVNTDDGLRDDALEILVAALDQHADCALAYADCAWTTRPNDIFPSKNIVKRVKYPDYAPIETLFYCLTGCLQFFRTESLRQLGGFDATLKCVGDYEVTLKMMAAHMNAVHVPEVLSLFYQNTAGLTQASDLSAREQVQVMNRHRAQLEIANIFKVEPGDDASASLAFAALASHSEGFSIPWENKPFEHVDFALECYQKALNLNPQNDAAATGLCVLLKRLNRLQQVQVQSNLVNKWPQFRPVIDHVLAGDEGSLPNAQHALLGPVYRPTAGPLVSELAPAYPSVARVLPSRPSLPVRWRGPIFNPSGYASEAINYILPLAEKVELGIHHLNNLYSAKFVAGLAESERRRLFELRDKYAGISGGITIDHNPANGFQYVPDAAYRIGRTMFETDRISPVWVAACNQMDEIWVPSQFNVETFAASGVERHKLVVMPASVDENEFNPDRHEPLPLPNRAAFNFLSIFEWSARKGWDVLLAAYLREFSAADDVCLYVRTYLFSKPDGDPATALWKLIRDYAATLSLGDKAWPRIELIAEQVPQADLPRLYKAADCLVAPSRGEGWGRPHHEAMMMGLPVIATNWSGNTEFMTPENSYLIGYEIVDTASLEPELGHYQGHRWANPSETDLRQAMRRVQQQPAEAQEKGRRARADMLRRYSRPPVTDLMVRRLLEIERKLTVPNCPPVAAKTIQLPARSSQIAPLPVKINWEGSFLDLGSLSHVNREMTAALAAQPELELVRVGDSSLPKKLKELSGLKNLSRQIKNVAPTAHVTIRQAWPPNWKRPASGAWVLMQPWEFGVLPADWVRSLHEVDEVWAISEYVRRVYVNSGVPPAKVKIVPNGIDPKMFHSQVAPMQLATQKKFKFLFVGGTIHRKGPDRLLEAYLASFKAADDVCLVIKDFGGDNVYAGQTFEAKIRAAQAQPGAPEILYLNTELPPEALPGLYTACDCLVHPYRGEGFGLPVLEAMACGLPVVVTGGGSTDDFATDEFAYRLPALQKSLGGTVGNFKLVRNGWWLEPDGSALAARMLWVFAHPEKAAATGRAASQHVRKNWTWERAAQIAAGHLQNLAARKQAEAADLQARHDRQDAYIQNVFRIGRLDEARELFSQKNYPAAWDATAAALARRPFHPAAWLLLAEIALAAGAGKNAKRCAQQAREFAPGWNPVKHFLSRPIKGEAQPEWLKLPKTISNLKSQISNRLSVCLIVKNEEKFLAACLKSVRGFATQIVVVDTGSTDRTVEIAREFGAEIYSFAWCDDFAAARNAALEHATGDWVLMLDADEELPAAQHAKLVADMNNPAVIALRLPLVNVGQENEGRSFVPRLFRNAPEVFFRGRIHEQVFSSLLVHAKKWGLKTALGTAELRHHGYSQEMLRGRNKVERNLKLLRQAVEECPGDANLLMNLGMELVRAGDLTTGLRHYGEAFQLMSSQPASEVVPELREVLLTQFTSHLYRLNGYAEVVRVLNSPLAQQGGLTASLHFTLGLAHFEQKQFSEAADQMRQCLAKRSQPGLTPINTDILAAAPQHCLALSLLKLDDRAGAEKAFRAAIVEPEHAEEARLDYAKFLQNANRSVDALQQLNEIVARNPRHLVAWRLGGEIALSRAEFLEFARDWTGAAFAAMPENPLLAAQRAEALMLNGDPAAAVELWEKIWRSEHEPRTLAALILCEAAVARTLHAPNAGPDEQATSRAFIEWYQKLLTARAQSVISQLNGRLEQLARVLPTAAQMVETALAETNVPAGV